VIPSAATNNTLNKVSTLFNVDSARFAAGIAIRRTALSNASETEITMLSSNIVCCASRVGDDDMLWADHAAIRFAIAKAGAIASTCRYEFKMQASGGADVAG
jgi:hypothetical protein